MYTLLTKKHFLLMLLCSLFLLVACGSNEQTTQGGNSTPTQSVPATRTASPTFTAQPSSTVQDIAPTATQIAKPMPTLSSNTSIVVTTDKTQYVTSDSITVTITNNLSAGVYASAYYTNCTPAQLQLKSGTAWTVLGRCPESTQSALVIQPGSPKVFVLHPTTSPMPSRAGSAGRWTSGTYRISFSYTLQPDPDSSQAGTNIVSDEFTINS